MGTQYPAVYGPRAAARGEEWNLSDWECFSLMGEALKRPLEDMFYLSDKLVSFLPTANFSVRLCQERELYTAFARSRHAGPGKTKTARCFVLRPKRDKGASAESAATSREPLHGELVQKKSQLHFRTVAYFSQHTLAAASWGVGGGPP